MGLGKLIETWSVSFRRSDLRLDGVGYIRHQVSDFSQSGINCGGWGGGGADEQL